MNRLFHRWLAASAALTLLGTIGSAQAEEGTVEAMAPWEGEGQVFQIAPEKVIFMGAFNGIVYLQQGEGALDAMIMLCPGTQETNLKDQSTKSTGYCTFQGASGDRVFARWDCEGKAGGCNGRMTLTGGTGQFEGITGGGEMAARTVLADLAANLESGSVVKSAAGLVVWPKLSYKIPEKKEEQ